MLTTDGAHTNSKPQNTKPQLIPSPQHRQKETIHQHYTLEWEVYFTGSAALTETPSATKKHYSHQSSRQITKIESTSKFKLNFCIPTGGDQGVNFAAKI